jgi:hypothetical protein
MDRDKIINEIRKESRLDCLSVKSMEFILELIYEVYPSLYRENTQKISIDIHHLNDNSIVMNIGNQTGSLLKFTCKDTGMISYYTDIIITKNSNSYKNILEAKALKEIIKLFKDANY